MQRLRKTELTTAPTLETERLLLRAHTLSDFDVLARLWSDPSVVRHITGRPSTEEESWSRLHRYAGHWAILGFGYFAVEEKATGAYVGDVGLADFRREMTPSFEGEPEAGWVISSARQGKGYATEAVHRVLRWSDETLRVRSVCMIAPENAASIRVAEKCGYREWTRAEYKGEQSVLFRRSTMHVADA